ncbi:MAG: hypothetical protein SNJ67_12095 [Chloracidobacterium sp.]|uniref:DUF4276 family protein n=1 Tax=Chloracidobacterium validum TaxID=2821543 RepID=A0ABX8BCQ0_9BACT|nr:hypothetical protein [Chloracidobacterium validum]QUW04202.1 hypothetical protein J8C06_14260 [Chloracidobacterium validum]
MTAIIQAAVEGITDEAVIRRLIHHVGAEPGAIHVGQGKSKVLKGLTGYNNAAQQSPWLVLVDLDQEPCPAQVKRVWLPSPAPWMCFRIAVRAVEAWLLADVDTLAVFLGVPPKCVPVQPETCPDPKAALVALAGHSRRREIRDAMIPQVNSGRRVGPAYTSQVINYARYHWQPQAAARRADSLRRAINCLQTLANQAKSRLV